MWLPPFVTRMFRSRRRTTPPAAEPTPLGSGTTLLHDQRSDARRAGITHPNAVTVVPHTGRRTPFTSAELERTVVEMIDAAVDAGSLDDAGLRFTEGWLLDVAHQEWGRIDAHSRAQERSWHAIYGQQRTEIRRTLERLRAIQADLRSADASYVSARDTLLGWPGTTPWTPPTSVRTDHGADIVADLPPVRPTSSTSPVRRGIDYSFLLVRSRDVPVWALDGPLSVHLVGPAPEGADALLQRVVGQVTKVSALPLRYAAPLASSDPADTGTITVSYVNDLQTDGTPEVANTLGVGGARSVNGTLVQGTVHLLRCPENDPTRPSAHHVMLHELLHALGLGHCAPGRPEVMCPTGTERTELGRGDREALSQIRVASVAPERSA